MTAQDLQPFCSTDETRFILMEPFTRDGFTWATDGRIMVRVPVIPGVEAKENAPKTMKCWRTYTEADPYGPLPDKLPPPWPNYDCDECGGDGITHCSACDHDRECPKCEGDGKITFDPRWMVINGGNFAVRYILMIAALPDIRIQVFPPNKERNQGFIRFAFDGGEGVFMDRTVSEKDKDDEWRPA